MRELKFRVWNGAEMVYNVTVGNFGVFYVNPGSNMDGLDEKDSSSLTTFTTKYSDETPVMQYTGLKDKNGKEIYEGDILHIAGMMDVKHGVTFEEGQFVMYEFGTNNYSPVLYEQYSKVVGNIYETDL